MEPEIAKALDHPLLRQTLFYPARLSELDVPVLPEGDIIRIPVGGDELGAYHYHPHSGAPLVLFFHGNGEVMVDYLYGFHQDIAELGHNFLVVDYRGYGLSGGSPTLSRLLEDANAAWDHVTGSMGVPAGRVVVMGRSLGSLAALEIAGGPGGSMRGLVVESGIGRFDGWVDRMGPMMEAMGADVATLKMALARAFNHEEKMKNLRAPALVMHAPFDEIVPVQNAHDLASFGDPGRTSLRIFEKGGHNDIQFANRDDYFQTLGDFLKSLGG